MAQQVERGTHDQSIVGSKLGQGISLFSNSKKYVRRQVAPSMLASLQLTTTNLPGLPYGYSVLFWDKRVNTVFSNAIDSVSFCR
jgi:hypothetical protein